MIQNTNPMVTENMAEAVELSITINAYLEAENLANLLPVIQHAAGALTPRYEILVLDTQTPMDNTAEVCAAFRVLHIPRAGGNSYGDATRTGIARARGTYILNMDADGSHSASYFAAMWAERERFDITIGSRYAPGGQTENPKILIWMSYVVNLTFRVAFSLRARDVTNSLRLYRSEVLKPMTLESNDFDILEEILIKAVIAYPKLRIGEVPVTFGRRQAGKSKRDLVRFAFGYVKTLRRLRTFARKARAEKARQAQKTGFTK